MRSRINTLRFVGAAVRGLFVALLVWISGTDLTHYLEMRERVSLAYDPSEDWPGEGASDDAY
jgi:hypothetical protein